jgi:hypothetical protein
MVSQEKKPRYLPGLFSRVDSLLEYREIFQQRDDADDDDNDPRDLFGAAIERQHVDQIEDQNNNEKCDQNTDEYGHCLPPLFAKPGFWLVAYRKNCPTGQKFRVMEPPATSNRRRRPAEDSDILRDDGITISSLEAVAGKIPVAVGSGARPLAIGPSLRRHHR